MDEKVLCISNVVKTIKNHKIIDDVSFDVGRGEIVGLVGANGAGKSSILKAVSHMISIDSGEIRYQNKLISGNKDSEYDYFLTKAGLVLNDKMLCNNMTGYHNLKNLELMYENITEEDIEKTIEIFDMRTYIKKKCKTYSYGMKQRILVAMAYIKNPKIYLLDEPTNGLDPDGIKMLKELMIKESHENGKSILISSHLLHDMVDCCDRIIFVRQGKVVNISTKKQICDNKGGIEQMYFDLMGDSNTNETVEDRTEKNIHE